jgi:site-specific recombinase XerD
MKQAQATQATPRNANHPKEGGDLQRATASGPSGLRIAFDDFMLSRRVMRCSPKTIVHYKYSAGGFVEWLEQRGVQSAGAVRPHHVRARLAGVADLGVKDTTLHVHARGIKTFVRFLHAEGYIDTPITFQMPRLDKKRMGYASADDLNRLVNVCKNPRDIALVLVMADSGLRLAETCSLTWGDVDAGSGLIRVLRGKGGKARTAVVGATTLRVVLEYRAWWFQNWGQEPAERDALWCSLRTGRALTISGISLALRRLGRAAGVKISAHMLRRTFATLSLRAGMNPLHLQELLGHSTLEMTKRYTQMVEDDLKEAHERFGPVDHWLADGAQPGIQYDRRSAGSDG